MDFQRGNISLWLAIATIILSTGLMGHVMAIPVILNVAGRDAWIAVILAAPFFIGWLLLYFHLMKNLQHTSFITWLEINWGTIAAWGMKILFSAILFCNALYTLMDTALWTSSTYLQQTPLIVVVLCLLIIGFFMAYSGLQSITIVSSILLPVVIFLGYFVSLSNVKYKDFSLLLPMFDNGILPSMRGGLYVLSALLDIWIIILFTHHVKKRISTGHIIFFALFLLMMVIGPITGGISEFGPTEALKQRHTAFDQWRILSLGQLFRHVDFFSIYQWLAGAIVRISISMYLMIDVFQFKKNKPRLILLSVLSVIMCSLMYLNWREDTMLIFLQNIYFHVLLIFVLVLTMVVGLTQMILNKKEVSQDES